MATTLPPYPQTTPVLTGSLLSAPWGQWIRTVWQLLGRIVVGSGAPGGVVIAEVGTIYLRTDGGAGSTLYIKEANSGAATGWVAK